MPPALFVRTPLGNPAAPTTDLSTIADLPEWMYEASEDWSFEFDSADNLVGRVNDSLLVQGGAVAPAHEVDHMATADGQNGMLTPFDDSNVQTVLIVAKKNAVVQAAQLLCGTATSNSAQGGFLLYWTPTNFGCVTRGGMAAGQILKPAGLDNNEFYFCGVSHTNAGAGQRVLYLGGAAPLVTAGVKTLAAPMRKLSLGNVHYNTANWQQGLLAGRMVVLDGVAADEDQFDAWYAEMRVHYARRGITLF